MLTPIFRNSGKTQRERYLASLATDQFFSLWCYPSLSRKAKRGVTKELADLTVAFGDDLILFSDKDIAWPTHSEVRTAWSRWYRAAILESAKQLWGAEKHLLSSDPSVFLDEKCETTFPFPLVSTRTRIHLIAVASNSIEPAAAYFSEIGGPGSSGTLIHAFGHNSIDGGQPFVVGDLDEKKTFVHVFDAETLDRVLTELGTVSDFVHYLSEKVLAIRTGRLAMYAGEEELLAFYLQERMPNGYGCLPFARQPSMSGRFLTIPEGEWRSYRNSEEYRVRSRMAERARDWFSLLDPFSAAVVSAQPGAEAMDTPLELHEMVLRVAASENLASRAMLATAFEEKRRSLPRDVRSSRAITSICEPGRLYIFVFVPWIEDGVTYEQYREFRLKVMQAYALVAPLKFVGAREVVVLGAQTPDATGTRSEAIICARYDEPLSSAHIAEATELMESERILSDFPPQSLQAKSSPASQTRRYGRNDLCPCGSLKKNKKCCNISGPRYNPIYSGRVN